MLCINTFGRVRYFPDQAKKKIQNGRTSTLIRSSRLVHKHTWDISLGINRAGKSEKQINSSCNNLYTTPSLLIHTIFWLQKLDDFWTCYKFKQILSVRRSQKLLYDNLPVQTKMAILSKRLILLAILLYEQFKHYTPINLRLNKQLLSIQQQAYQSFLSHFLL